MLSNYGAGEDSWESLGLQGDQISQSQRKSTLNTHWKEWCWSWSFDTLATWCEQPIHWKRPWCWERLKAGREGDDRGWDGWMASPMQWTGVWVGSRSWWWTGKPGVLQSTGSQRVEHNWETELTNYDIWNNVYITVAWYYFYYILPNYVCCCVVWIFYDVETMSLKPKCLPEVIINL